MEAKRVKPATAKNGGSKTGDDEPSGAGEDAPPTQAQSTTEEAANGVTDDEEAAPEAADEASVELSGKLYSTSVGVKTTLRLPRTLETTLFDRLERLYGPGIKRVLKVQYR